MITNINYYMVASDAIHYDEQKINFLQQSEEGRQLLNFYYTIMKKDAVNDDNLHGFLVGFSEGYKLNNQIPLL